MDKWHRPGITKGRMAFWVAMALCLLLTSSLVPSAKSAEPTSIYVLDSTSGSWVQLPPVNDFAACGIGGPSGPAPVSFDVHAAVTQSDQEITMTATPLTDNIRLMPDGSFEASADTTASWRVHLQVTNGNQNPMTELAITDEFGAAFLAVLESPYPGSASLSQDAGGRIHLIWRPGDLAPGASVGLNLKLMGRRDSSSRPQFNASAVYELNAGASLRYRLTGISCDAKTEAVQVKTLSHQIWNNIDLPWGKPDFGTLEIRPLTVGGIGTASVGGSSSTGSLGFSEKFEAISPSIITLKDGADNPIGFEVPLGQRVEWRVVLTVVNNTGSPVSGITVTEHISAELKIDPATVVKTPPESTFSIEVTGNTKITWNIPGLIPDQQAVLSFVIYTGLNPSGKQQYNTPTTPTGPYFLNSGATLKYTGHSIELPPVPVWVPDNGMEITISACRWDWEVRKPGIFAAAPIVITVKASRRVSLDFNDFADLRAIAPATGQIPTFYHIGETLPGPGGAWIPAAGLNVIPFITTPAQVGTTVTWRIWPMIRVNDQVQAGQYEDLGTLTIIALDVEAFVENENMVHPMTIGEVGLPEL